MKPTKENYQSIWNRVETKSGLDRQQFWRLALDKKSFNSYVGERYGNLNGESPEWGNRMYVCMLSGLRVLIHRSDITNAIKKSKPTKIQTLKYAEEAKLKLSIA